MGHGDQAPDRTGSASCNGSATVVRVMAVYMAADAANSECGSGTPAVVASFDEFYESQYRPVVRLAAALVGRWDVAEELAQDAFVALHARWGRVSEYDSPESWLRRVVVNRSLSALRRRKVEARLLVRLAAERGRDVHLSASDRDLWQVVAMLPKRQAQVVALTYVDCLTAIEVAAVLGCSENTVRTHLRRARASLAERLGDTSEES
jgi:RNA polymerase sigma factor (sigma-70 family)